MGFTLIEVLIALVLLAVGLLALEGLGIYAIRSVALAGTNSRAANVAMRYLEPALDSLSRGHFPASLNCSLANGDRIVRVVNVSNPRLPQVTVTVTPAPTALAAAPITVNSYVYSWNPTVGAVPSSTECS